MKVLYVLRQISDQLVPFYSFYLSCPSRKFWFIGLFYHLCYEISGHPSLRQVVQIDKICIFMCRITMVYSFLITRCPNIHFTKLNHVISGKNGIFQPIWKYSMFSDRFQISQFRFISFICLFLRESFSLSVYFIIFVTRSLAICR